MPESDFDDLDFDLDDTVEAVAAEVSESSPPPPVTAEVAFAEMDADDGDFEESLGIMADMVQENASSIDLSKPWMKYHKFTLVKTADEVKALVDRCLEVGRCALDLETEGFDNRIEYDAQGKPYTVHAIVGYCLGLEEEGYYIPVRHHHDPMDPDPNIDSVARAEAEITRLCQEAQPILVEGCRDLLGARDSEIETPSRVTIEFWHSKFDQEFLYPITGIDIWHPSSFEDGMLANYVLYTDDSHGLKENAESKIPPTKEGGHPYEMIKFEDLFLKRKKKNERKFKYLTPRTSGEGWNAVLYGCSDGICTNMLCKLLVPQAKKPRFASMYKLEKQVVQAVRVLERARVLIDKDEIMALLTEAEEELKSYEDRIRSIAVGIGFPDDFNPASSAQLADFLFGPNGLNLPDKPEMTSGGQYKTDESTIEAYYNDHPGAPEVLLMIIKHRQINKVKGTYLENLARNTDSLNQLRLNFKQTGAATGRFTAPKGDPEHGFGGVPIQGIPGRDDPKKPKVAHSLRRVFVAREDYVYVKVDYASQELRIAANVSGERKWIAEYEKEVETGIPADLHFLTAQAFYPGLTVEDSDYKLKRGAGKTANFALVYGGGVGAVQRATGCDKVEGARLKQAFDESVPQFSKWVKKQHAGVKKNKGVVTGFRRFIAIPDAAITAEEYNKRLLARGKPVLGPSEVKQEIRKIRAACERKSTNFPIQGSGADILKISLMLLLRELHLRGWLKNGGDDSVRMVMTVHDEIVFEIRKSRVAEAVPILVKLMEYPSTLAGWKVPLIAEPELGSSWSAKTDWLKMLRGAVPRPDYLEGAEIDPDPQPWVLMKSNVPQPQPKAPAKDPYASKSEEAPKEEAKPERAPPEKRPSSPPPRAFPKFTKVASFKLKSSYITYDTVCSIVEACATSTLEAAKDGIEDLCPVEFFDGLGNTLYSTKEGYFVYPEGLNRALKRLNLVDRFEVKEVL